MNWTQEIRSILLIGIVFLIPLVRLSLEDFSATRHTWSWLTLFSFSIITIFILNHKDVQRKNIILPLICILFLLGSSIIATYPANALSFLFMVAAIAFAYAASSFLTRKNVRAFCLTLLCAISLYAQWGIAQFIIQHDFHMQFIGESIINANTSGVASFYIDGQKYIRAYGPFGHANSLSGILLIGCLLLAAMRIRHPLFIYSLGATFALGLVLTFSRSAIIAGIALALYALILYKRKAILLILLIIALFSPLILGRSVDSHDVAAHDRLQGLQWGMQMSTPSSLLRGYGIGNYETALQAYLMRHGIRHNAWDVAPIHSTPIHIIAEFGIILSSIIMFGIFYIIKKNNLWILGFLLPPLLLDHYYITQLGPLIYLISCAIILSRVYYKREQANNIVH